MPERPRQRTRRERSDLLRTRDSAVPTVPFPQKDPVVSRTFGLFSQGAFKSRRYKRNHYFVVPRYAYRLSRVLRGPLQHILSRAVVLNKVQIGCREFFEAISEVSHN